ncbi:MAG: methyltransferase domain-containing protein [Hydrotalea sp.]|nr:methyltransferase domain-containing protein [Hydrotalea sp.]
MGRRAPTINLTAPPLPAGMEKFLAAIETTVRHDAPDLLAAFLVHKKEAEAARAWLDNDLQQLRRGARLLEIGAGVFLLACQLQAEGFQVVAVEPLAPAYGKNATLQKIILAHAKKNNISPTIKNCFIEDYKDKKEKDFDFAYAINVMFQVPLVPALVNIIRLLKPLGRFHFISTNYSFPYEPDFHIPNLLSKKLTEKVFYKKIFLSNALIHKKEVSDAKDYWQRLNWISPRKIKKILHQQRKSGALAQASFDRQQIIKSLSRVFYDQEFVARHGRLVVGVIKLLFVTRAMFLFSYLPASWHPVIDCTIIKRA